MIDMIIAHGKEMSIREWSLSFDKPIPNKQFQIEVILPDDCSMHHFVMELKEKKQDSKPFSQDHITFLYPQDSKDGDEEDIWESEYEALDYAKKWLGSEYKQRTNGPMIKWRYLTQKETSMLNLMGM